MSNWPLAFMELAIVLAFAVGWMILEWQGRRLDRQRDERERKFADVKSGEPDHKEG